MELGNDKTALITPKMNAAMKDQGTFERRFKNHPGGSFAKAHLFS